MKIITRNSDHRSLIYGKTVPRVQVYTETNPGWLQLPLIQTNFHGPKTVQATEFLMYAFLNTDIYFLIKHSFYQFNCTKRPTILTPKLSVSRHPAPSAHAIQTDSTHFLTSNTKHSRKAAPTANIYARFIL